ncbi:MAG: hypothetical protein WBM01_30805 [Mycobacterium sp.]
MTPREEPPDVDRLARSMLMLHGDHDSHDEPALAAGGRRGESWSKAPAFADDPQRAAAVHEATQADRTRYLTTGLQAVDCRFCHATVNVKRLGPGHTAVQWNTDASQRCAYFAELRASGEDSARTRACPRLTDSIEHAVAEGCLEAVSTAPPAGDG